MLKLAFPQGVNHLLRGSLILEAFFNSLQRSPVFMALFALPITNLIKPKLKSERIDQKIWNWVVIETGKSTFKRIIFIIGFCLLISLGVETCFVLLLVPIKGLSFLTLYWLDWQKSIANTLAAVIALIILEGEAPLKRQG
ncbi:hypothetical protein [Lentilactobacillus hilgardii]|uniref:hypothetical protein n=1 Tax=Lentilactobacillus hilgardii TaxID=1588 RepID=UPI0021A408E0|nr:hypothetical protein [Lentilactobacillus hilgardii]